MRRRNKLWLLIAILCGLCSCSDDIIRVGSDDSDKVHKVRIAMILPLNAEDQVRWTRLSGWIQENFLLAQTQMEQRVELEFEWYDEETSDLEALGKELAQRTDIFAIVGPVSSTNVRTVAYQCARTNKTLIAPSASSAEVVRAFSSRQFLWALSETDISQCEVMLVEAQSKHCENVALIAPDTDYGQTFVDWFAFQATELGMHPLDVVVYNGENRSACIERAMQSGADALLCVPSCEADTEALLAAGLEYGAEAPRLIFSDAAFKPYILDFDPYMVNSTTGISVYAAPESGFEIAYQELFGELPTANDVRVYDALLLCALSAADCFYRGEEHVDANSSLMRIVDGDEDHIIAWDAEGMEQALQMMFEGRYPHAMGASGYMTFDSETYTCRRNSTYCSWMVLDGKFHIMGFYSTDGSNRTDPTLAGWNWRVSELEEMNELTSPRYYPELQDHWALLVAASSTWVNYRHQADVLNMYRILRESGYDDQHIILIMEDDLAYHANNLTPGEIRNSPDGINLYTEDVQIDYKLSDLRPDDIRLILGGECSERLPFVVEATDRDNVLVFWSGHGVQGSFVWNDGQEGFSHDLMRQTLEQLSRVGAYRKMLWLIETCYSSSVAKAAVGIPGVLCFAAADEREPSKADTYNYEMNMWMTNRFSSVLCAQLEECPEITYRDLYLQLTASTIGSHVRVHNAPLFDNLYLTGISEFLPAIAKKVKKQNDRILN